MIGLTPPTILGMVNKVVLASLPDAAFQEIYLPLKHAFDNSICQELGIIDLQAVRQALASAETGHGAERFYLVQLIQIELWLRKYFG